jgi:hypothetical protein
VTSPAMPSRERKALGAIVGAEDRHAYCWPRFDLEGSMNPSIRIVMAVELRLRPASRGGRTAHCSCIGLRPREARRGDGKARYISMAKTFRSRMAMDFRKPFGPLAEQGDADAQIDLGLIYRWGMGS